MKTHPTLCEIAALRPWPLLGGLALLLYLDGRLLELAPVPCEVRVPVGLAFLLHSPAVRIGAAASVRTWFRSLIEPEEYQSAGAPCAAS